MCWALDTKLGHSQLRAKRQTQACLETLRETPGPSTDYVSMKNKVNSANNCGLQSMKTNSLHR